MPPSAASIRASFPTCDPTLPTGGSFANPWGTTLGPALRPAIPADIVTLPNAAAIESGSQLFSFGVYNRANKLPYTMNQTLDIQWQPRNDLAIDIGYVGNLGRHEIIPIPFNQAGNRFTHATRSTARATRTATRLRRLQPDVNPRLRVHTTCTPAATNCDPAATMGCPMAPRCIETIEGGNVDLRVPYIGYSSESESYTAAGISAYNALQVARGKAPEPWLAGRRSPTPTRTPLDEQSALGLFYNGNNPLNLRSGYGNSDFDRTHVINFNYLYQLPKFFAESSLTGKFADGWAVEGLTVLQSGQPYSVIDYSGAVGSIFYGTSTTASPTRSSRWLRAARRRAR